MLTVKQKENLNGALVYLAVAKSRVEGARVSLCIEQHKTRVEFFIAQARELIEKTLNED